MHYKKIFISFFLLTAFISVETKGQAVSDKNTTEALKDFMDMRFGMFIHWGPVSLRGTEIGWSRGREVPTAEYDNLYKEFDPVLFNANDWVKTAKDAGMKYLTITARHHDGFCLWPTKFTDYNIMNTPYKKDIVNALMQACKKQGIKFCIYYSVLDWYHPDYPLHTHSGNPAPDPKSDMSRYINFMKKQLEELITNYDPYMLFFDGQWESPWTNEMGKDIYAYLKKLNPAIIINNRLGKEFAAMENKAIDASKMIGDYDTPEQVVGRLNMQTAWESCFTICTQWSWKPNDKMKTLQQCLNILSRTAGGNGNLLLNVGPMPDGRIEARQVSRLQEVGNWLKLNGEAIYNTKGGPYEPEPNYATTRKENKIFLHVLNADTAVIALKNIPGSNIIKAYTIKGEKVSIETGAETFRVLLPASLTEKTNYIIVLELDGNAENIPVIK